MADYRDDEGIVIEEASDSDFAEEHDDPVACVVQRSLCNKRHPTLHSKIKSFIQGIRSRIRNATSSLTMKAVRASCREHL